MELFTMFRADGHCGPVQHAGQHPAPVAGGAYLFRPTEQRLAMMRPLSLAGHLRRPQRQQPRRHQHAARSVARAAAGLGASSRSASAESIVPLLCRVLVPDAGVAAAWPRGMLAHSRSAADAVHPIADVRSVERQRARVDRHADDGVDAEGVERVDLGARGDAAGGGQLALGGLARRP